MHFVESIEGRYSPKEMKEKVKEYLGGYTEAGDCWNELCDRQPKALERSRGFVVPNDKKGLEQMGNGTNIHELFDEVDRRKNGGTNNRE